MVFCGDSASVGLFSFVCKYLFWTYYSIRGGYFLYNFLNSSDKNVFWKIGCPATLAGYVACCGWGGVGATLCDDGCCCWDGAVGSSLLLLWLWHQGNCCWWDNGLPALQGDLPLLWGLGLQGDLWRLCTEVWRAEEAWNVGQVIQLDVDTWHRNTFLLWVQGNCCDCTGWVILWCRVWGVTWLWDWTRLYFCSKFSTSARKLLTEQQRTCKNL